MRYVGALEHRLFDDADRVTLCARRWAARGRWDRLRQVYEPPVHPYEDTAAGRLALLAYDVAQGRWKWPATA